MPRAQAPGVARAISLISAIASPPPALRSTRPRKRSRNIIRACRCDMSMRHARIMLRERLRGRVLRRAGGGEAIAEISEMARATPGACARGMRLRQKRLLQKNNGGEHGDGEDE